MANAGEPGVTLPVSAGPKSDYWPKNPSAQLAQREARIGDTIPQSRQSLEPNSKVPHVLHRAYLRLGPWSRAQRAFQQETAPPCGGGGAARKEGRPTSKAARAHPSAVLSSVTNSVGGSGRRSGA